MLSAGHRLRHRRDFATAVRRGRRAGRPLLVAHLYVAEDRRSIGRPGRVPRVPPDSASPPRIGFVVSKAVGGAVVRNAVKRRLRHICRGRTDRLAPGSFLVVRALPGAGSASSADLAGDLDEALRRLGHGGPDRSVP